jgi:hypothetical protein
MSEADAEIVRGWLDAAVGWFDSPGDLAELAEINARYMAHDVTYEEDPVWPDAGAYQGPDADLQAIRAQTCPMGPRLVPS